MTCNTADRNKLLQFGGIVATIETAETAENTLPLVFC